jgi:hypothetical protein
MPVEGGGIHRAWYTGGRWAYVSVLLDGFTDYMFMTVDMSDPAKPREVGRWWIPGMNFRQVNTVMAGGAALRPASRNVAATALRRPARCRHARRHCRSHKPKLITHRIGHPVRRRHT